MVAVEVLTSPDDKNDNRALLLYPKKLFTN